MIHASIAAAVASLCVETKPLAAAVAFLNSKIVERRNTVPILSCLTIGASEAGGVRLYANNLDTAAALEIDGAWSGGEPFAIAVDSAALADALRKCDGSLVDLTFEATEQSEFTKQRKPDRLVIASGRARFTVHAHPVDEFPTLSGPTEDSPSWETPVADLAADLAALAPSVGTEETRYYLCGIAFQARGELRAVATDGHQMGIIKRPLPDSAASLEDSILPTAAIKAVLAALKKRDGVATVTFGNDRAEIALDGVRIVSKLIDGTFPNYGATLDTVPTFEFQAVALPELEPRLNAGALAKLEKGIGAPLTVATAPDAPFALVTCAARPDYQAISILLKEGAAAKGFGYETGPGEDARMRAYAIDLAAARDLPPPVEGGHAIIRDGFAVGYQFGTAEYLEPVYEMRLNYERLVEERVQVGGGLTYPNGAYSVPFARDERHCVAAVSLVDGERETPLRTNAAGALELSAKAVATLCGEIDPASFVEIPVLTFHHGRIIARDGIATDGTGRRFVGFGALQVFVQGKGNRHKLRAMTDSEATRTYDADAKGTIARLAPQWETTVDKIEADVPTEAAIPVDMSGDVHSIAPLPVEECIICHGPVPAGCNTCDGCVEEAESDAQDAPADATPATDAETVDDAPTVPQIDEAVAMEAAGETIGALIGELRARIEALEAAGSAKPEPETVASPALEIGASSAESARIAELEAELEAMRARADKADARAEALEFDRADLVTRLAAAELLATEAKAIYEPQLDAKQAEIVRLTAELREWLVFGRAPKRLTAEARPSAPAVFKSIGGGCHALVISPGGAQ